MHDDDAILVHNNNKIVGSNNNDTIGEKVPRASQREFAENPCEQPTSANKKEVARLLRKKRQLGFFRAPS
jgi:hypothetical protein